MMNTYDKQNTKEEETILSIVNIFNFEFGKCETFAWNPLTDKSSLIGDHDPI